MATAAYIYSKGLANSALPSGEDLKLAELGQMGDYFGGLLNPIVALAALILLAWSVRIQKQELSETRAALESSSAAQEIQARASLVSVRLAALTAVHDVLSHREPILRERIYTLTKQIMAASGNSGGYVLMQTQLVQLQKEQDENIKRQDEILHQINEILKIS